MVNAQKRSSYLDYLPGIFDGGQTSFLNGFLLAFERLLTGLGEPSDSEDTLRGIEESLDGIRTVDGKWQQAGIERYFSPQSVIPKEERATGSQDERFQTPKEFLDWLAGWVALEIRIDLDESERRALIARAVQLYRLRGTKAGLEQLLEILTAPFTREQERLALKLPPNSVEKLGGIAGQSYGHKIEIQEPAPMQLGEKRRRLGVDTWLGDPPPHFFRVVLRLDSSEPERRRRLAETVRAIVDVEKPAHTCYDLVVIAPTFRLGQNARLGRDTLLDIPNR